MKPYLKITLLVVFIIALSGIMSAVYMYNKPHKDFTEARTDFALSADDLQKEFGANESAATAKYMNKTIEVTGTVSSINPGEGKALSITLKTGNEASSVICSLAGNIKPDELKPGQNVTLRGELSGYLMDVILNECVIVRSKP